MKALFLEIAMLKMRRNLLLYVKTLALYGALLALLPCPSVNKGQGQEGVIDHKIVQALSVKQTPTTHANRPFYDYSRMISLIEQCRQIKKEFYHLTSQPSSIDLIMAQNIITELKKERFSLLDHINENKTFFNQRIPVKRKKALRYYTQIISKYIVLLKAITQKQQTINQKQTL
jgi:hypothetical protein